MRIGTVLFAGIALAACGSPNVVAMDDAGAVEAPATDVEIIVGNAFIMAPIAGRTMTMGGLDVAVNGGDVRLVSVNGLFAETIELHTMSMDEGVMQMRKVEGFDIADGQTLQLERGGNHLMIFGASDLLPGESEEIALTFELPSGETEMVEATARIQALGE
ncbi:MAG: copper chaperone PCu(A)C [Pseudomonadota bacterium]